MIKHLPFLMVGLLAVSISQTAISQSLSVNITGAVANASSILDISSNTKGLLVPRMTKVEKNAIASPANGLLIYQTSPDSIGFHYYESGSWIWLSASIFQNAQVWKLTGNLSTVDGTNFIGTTDDIPFNFRVNNQRSGRIASSGETFLGYQAGNVNTSGYSTGIGYQTLASNTSGDNNTAIGFQALYSNTTGYDNTATGQSALLNNTTGFDNTATGFQSLAANTSGRYNTAMGQRALTLNSTGYNNTAMGLQALERNTTGFSNTAIGMQVLQINSTGNSNTAVGLVALQANTTGEKNTSLGVNSLYHNTTGNNNLAMGVEPLFSNTTGNNNIALGIQSLRNNTTGNNNIAIGSGALFTSGLTSNQVAVGDSSLYFSTGNTFSANGNTALGSKAGYNVTAGIRNVFIGYQAGYNATGSNSLYIANSNIDPPLIYGNFALGRLGLGTLDPQSTLQVNGTIAIGVSNSIAGGTSGSPVSLANQKSYVSLLPADASNNYYQLPSPSVCTGRTYIIRNNSAVDETNITTASGLLFIGNSNTGVSTYTLNAIGSPKIIMCISDGINWMIMKVD